VAVTDVIAVMSGQEASMPDETTRAAALKRGEVDIAYFLNGPVPEDVRRTPGLKLGAMRTYGTFFLDFVDQWDPKSPWADRRVRLAASLSIDRRTINEAEQLGFAGLTGNIVPRHMEFALPIDPHRTTPAAPSSSSSRPATRTASPVATSRLTRRTSRWRRR
jgi:ABC-type transport system substrate-binding protein